MKKIANRILVTIVAMHLMIMYMAGFSLTPFDMSGNYVFVILPVVALIGFAFWWLEELWKQQKAYQLKKSIVATGSDLMFWLYLLVSSLMVICIMYYVGQLLLSGIRTNVLILMVSSLVYCYCLFAIKKILHKHWQ